MNMTGKRAVITGGFEPPQARPLTPILGALDDRFVSFKPAFEASVTWP
jgi:hypothetical protein